MIRSLTKTSASTLALVCGFLSTSYAHTAPLFSCVFEDAEEETRFEFKVREGENDGLLTYKYSPIANPAVVQGQIQTTKTNVTWSHFVYTGRDSQAEVKLSVPAGLTDNTVYLQMEVKVGEQTLEPRQFLQCNKVR